MGSRGKRMLALATAALNRDEELLLTLDIPKYESTKSTTRDERNACIINYSNLVLENDFISKDRFQDTASVYNFGNSPYISSESDFIPDEDSVSSQDSSAEEILNKYAKWRDEKQIKKRKIEKVDKNNGKQKQKHKDIRFSEEFNDSDDSGHIDSIVIQSSKQSHTGKRIRDKRHCCYLCQKTVCNLSRHLELLHAEDTSVAKILALPKKSRRRRVEFLKLSRLGNFYNNCEVIQLRKGQLILSRRPTPREIIKYSYVNYGPCPDCLGFMLKQHLWTHIKSNCPENKKAISKTDINKRQPLAMSNGLLNGMFGHDVSGEYACNILQRMRDDLPSKICKDDSLIVQFGSLLYEKYSTSQSELIRQSMRQLGRLLLEIKNATALKTLSECLKPQHFDTIVHFTKTLCVTHASVGNRPDFQKPSLALKIGHALKKCAAIERGSALRKGNLKRNEELISFVSIMDLEWNIKVSSNALNTLYKRKFNETQLLPLTSDLVKLNQFLECEMKKYKEQLEKCTTPNVTSWRTFAEIILSRIVLFNKRRSGEAASITVDQYLMRPMWAEQGTEELKQSMTTFEKTLAERLAIVEIRGKRGRKVPILLTPELKTCLDLLLRLRPLVGVSKQNPYIFARSNNSLEHLRGHDCIRKFCDQANLQSPENINGTKLQKYVATVCQIFNLTENESDWVARHLGHDIRVHREFYRLHESAVELTKVSRLLLAIDQGKASMFTGKQLKDIEISDLPVYEEDEASDHEENFESIEERENEGHNNGDTNVDITETLMEPKKATNLNFNKNLKRSAEKKKVAKKDTGALKRVKLL